MKYYMVDENYEVQEYTGNTKKEKDKIIATDANPSLLIGPVVFETEREAYFSALKEIRIFIKSLQSIEEKIIKKANERNIFTPIKPDLKDVAKGIAEIE